MIDMDMEIMSIKTQNTVSLASQKDTYEQVLTMKEQQLTNLNTRLTKLQEDFQAMNEEKVMA